MIARRTLMFEVIEVKSSQSKGLNVIVIRIIRVINRLGGRQVFVRDLFRGVEIRISRTRRYRTNSCTLRIFLY